MAAQDISTLGTQRLTFPTIDSNSDLSSALASISALQNAGKSANELALESQYKTGVQNVSDLLSLASNRGNRELQLRQEQNTSGLTSELQGIRSQIAAEQGALGIGKVQLEKTTRPLEAVRGEQDLLDRQATARLTALTAREQALTGNIALANDLIAKTLDLEYKPIQDKIDATLKVLSLNKELLSDEQKKRADALTIVLNQQKQNIEDDKAVKSKVISQSMQYPDAGISPTDSIEVANAKVLASPSYRTQRQRDINLANGSATSGLSPKITAQVDTIRQQFNTSPIVKNFVEVQNKKLAVDNIVNQGASGPADVAIIFDFMKALDPTSVVRESEYATAAKSGNIFLGSLARFNGYFKETGGFVPENVKREFQKIINQKYNAVESQYDNLYNESSRIINQKTGQSDGSDYLINYKSVPTTKNAPTLNDLPQTSSNQDNSSFFGSILKNLFK